MSGLKLFVVIVAAILMAPVVGCAGCAALATAAVVSAAGAK